jgi:hypothetical protein
MQTFLTLLMFGKRVSHVHANTCVLIRLTCYNYEEIDWIHDLCEYKQITGNMR